MSAFSNAYHIGRPNKKYRPAFGHLITVCVAAWMLPLQISAYACKVPVFRYALERWPASPYQAVILADAPLTTSEQGALRLLQGAGDKTNGVLNLTVRQYTKTELARSGMAGRLPQLDIPGPRLHLFFPAATEMTAAIWSGPLTKKSAMAIIDSRIRQELVRKLLAGNSGVFILLESGNQTRDAHAEKVLKGHLANLAASLKLPPGVVATDGAVTGDAPAGADPINQLRSAIPLKLAFSSLRLARKGADDILVATLMNLEPDLGQSSHLPMVFTVYGRGRALVPLIGRGITARNVGDVATFLTGPCSCQIKALNPGTDLLLRHDWDRSVLGENEQ